MKAPVVVAVFMTEAHFYDAKMIEALKMHGCDDKAIMHMFADYDILSVGAAVQNLLLAVHEKGYGACWMNEPAITGTEINKILGEQEKHRFMSLIPIGVAAYTPREKKMKELFEVYSCI